MVIRLEDVNERIAQYEADIEKMKVTLQAYDGALQDAKFWRDRLLAEDNSEVESGNAT